MVVENVDFGNMKEHEILAFHSIMMALIGKHFTKSAVDYIKKHLDAATIVDSKEDSEIIDPVGIPGYFEPGWPYFGKPIKFITKENNIG